MSAAAADREAVLAIDLGSGGPKVGLISARGEIIDHARRATPTEFLPDGGVEQDPDIWWQAISDCVRELRDRQSDVRIAAVCGTGQWSVTVPVKRDGQPLMRAVHWMDARGAPYTRRVTDGWIKVSGYGLRRLARWLRITGGAPTHSGADALAHMLFIRHERPDVYRATHKFLEPMDYINLRLTGRMAASYATIFPYLLADVRDPQHIDYDDLLLRWSGIERAKLPELLPMSTIVGPVLPTVAAEWGLAEGTPVAVASGDSQAAVLGSGAVDDFAGHLCIGTSSWLTCHVPFKKTDIWRNLATMPSALPGRNMVVAEQGPAGKCLEVVSRQWLLADHETSSADGALFCRAEELAASAPPGSEGLLFLPWLNGAGPPSGEATARGGFLNQSLRSTRAHALRAVMEGVAYNLRWLRESVEVFLGRRFESLRFIGGGAQSPLWCQTLADVHNRPIEQVAGPSEAILRGAAASAWLTLGRIKVEDIPAMSPIAQTFTPNAANRSLFDRQYQAFRESFQANRRLFARLNRATSMAHRER